MKKYIPFIAIVLISLFSFSQHGNEKNGPYTKQYKSGELKIEGNYKNGNKVGVWKHYYKNG